jgi:hypothetical protein
LPLEWRKVDFKAGQVSLVVSDSDRKAADERLSGLMGTIQGESPSLSPASESQAA